MQYPRQLKVKTIEMSPQDVLFPKRSEKLTKQRIVATIPRFSTELLTTVMRLVGRWKITTTHENTRIRIKYGVYNAITSYDLVRNITRLRLYNFLRFF